MIGASSAFGVMVVWNKTTHLFSESLRLLSWYIQSIAATILGVITLAVLFPLNLELFDPKTKDKIDPNQTPILLIHGFLGSSNNWIYHRYRLRSAGFKNVFTVNLPDPRKSIDDFAIAVKDKIEKIRELTGRDDIILIAHSMGGLVALRYLYNHANTQGIKVKKVITMGTPHEGTKMGFLGAWASKAAHEMRLNSSFIQQLHRQASLDEETHHIRIGTRTDCIIRPPRSALGGKAKKIETLLLEKTSHIGYLFSDISADHVLDTLKEVSVTA
jgi:triacylglycerol esterase/lipase EstA (alpha/beta hydrolase family)